MSDQRKLNFKLQFYLKHIQFELMYQMIRSLKN